MRPKHEVLTKLLGDHSHTGIAALPGGGVRAYCTCSWTGPNRFLSPDIRGQAQQDLHSHLFDAAIQEARDD